VDGLFDNRLASDGYFRKYLSQVNDKPITSLHLQDNDYVRSRDAEPNCLRDFSSSSKSSSGGWLRTGVDIVDFRNNNHNTNRSSFSNLKLRYPPSSTEVADLSRVLQKVQALHLFFFNRHAFSFCFPTCTYSCIFQTGVLQ